LERPIVKIVGDVLQRLNPPGLSPRLCDREGKRHGYPTGERRKPTPAIAAEIHGAREDIA
jgi:hypothetical protein